jgi:DNA-binding transcriptional MocR family regulator
MDDTELLQMVRSHIPALTSRGLSRTIMELVAKGEIPAGRKMPTVRAMAAGLRMSAASVAQAWGELVRWHVFETRRRGGTYVLGMPQAPRARRFDNMIRASDNIQINLGNLTPDVDLLPPLNRAMEWACSNPKLHDPFPFRISDALLDAVRPLWPFEPEGFLATHGGIDAMELALRSTTRPGDRVVVENPGIARVLDIIEAIGAIPVPIDYRAGGPDLGQLKQALAKKPAAMIYQPLSQAPTGHCVSPMWLEAAAGMVADVQIPVFELSQGSLLHDDAGISIGTYLPNLTVRIHSYNYFFGSSLRVGVVGGSADVIDRMWQPYTFSSRWVSRILQDALAFQLTDPEALAHLERYVQTARRRHQHMLGALRIAGFDLHDSQGQSVWLPVRDEQVTATHMATHGIVVHPGRYFSPVPMPQHHVLVNSTLLDDATEVANLLFQSTQ